MNALYKFGVKAVRSVKSDAVNVPLFYPHLNSVQKIINNLAVSEIELNKVIAVVPALVPEAVIVSGISAEIQSAEPAAVTGTLPVLLDIKECKMLSADVVENAVKDNSDAVFVQSLAYLCEVLVSAKAFVNFCVIGGVIAVSRRLKDRSEVNGLMFIDLR